MGVRDFAETAPLVWRSPTRALKGFAAGVLALALLTLIFDLAVIRAFPPAADRGETRDLWPVVLNVAHGQGMVGCTPKWFPGCGPTNQVTAMHEPVPVLVFAGVAALAHDSLNVVALVQVIVSVLTVVGVTLLTRQMAGPMTALVAGAVWAVYLPAVRLVPQVAGDLLAGLGLTWGLLAFVYAQRTDRRLAWLAVGVCLGLGALSRSVVMVVAPTLVIALLLVPPSPTRSRGWSVRRGALVLAACAVVQLPWAVRNEIALGRPVLGSTLVGYNLFREAQALDSPDYMRYVTADEGLEAIQDLFAARPELAGANEAQVESVYRQEALPIIAAHPLRFTALTGGRFLMLWFNWRVGGSDIDAKLNGAMGYFPDVQQVVLFAGGLLGLFVLPWRRSWPLVATIGVWCLAHMAVHAQQRYIVPMMPLVVASAAVAGAYVVQRVGHQPVVVAADAARRLTVGPAGRGHAAPEARDVRAVRRQHGCANAVVREGDPALRTDLRTTVHSQPHARPTAPGPLHRRGANFDRALRGASPAARLDLECFASASPAGLQPARERLADGLHRRWLVADGHGHARHAGPRSRVAFRACRLKSSPEARTASRSAACATSGRTRTTSSSSLTRVRPRRT
jgi:Dolichyl-phosphate-mannose-protein mannosyltransferase